GVARAKPALVPRRLLGLRRTAPARACARLSAAEAANAPLGVAEQLDLPLGEIGFVGVGGPHELVLRRCALRRHVSDRGLHGADGFGVLRVAELLRRAPDVRRAAHALDRDAVSGADL